MARRSKNEDATAAIGGILPDFDEAAALERFQRGGESGAIHGEQRSDGRHGWRLGPVEGDEQRELSIGEAEGAKRGVEATRKGAGCALHVETEAAVPDHEGGSERKLFFA